MHGLMDADVLATLSADPRIERRELDDAAALPGRIHSKYFLINGQYVGKHAKWVFTGSPNWNVTLLAPQRRGNDPDRHPAGARRLRGELHQHVRRRPLTGCDAVR